MKLRQFARTTLVAAGAVATTASAAQAYQHNYTCQGDPGLCAPGENFAPIVWEQPCVSYYLDQAGSPDFQPAGPRRSDRLRANKALEQAVIASFDAWNAPACAGVSLRYSGLVDADDRTRSAHKNVVSFRAQDWPHISTTVFATTLITYQPATGIIRKADIHVNNEYYRFSVTPTPAPGAADLQNTLTHEAGHLLGIAHSEVPDASMYGAAHLGETSKRTLHTDDIAALCHYYPARPGALSCEDSGPSSNTEQGTLLPGDGQHPGPSLPDGLDNAGCTTSGTHAAPSQPLWVLLLGIGVPLARAARRSVMIPRAPAHRFIGAFRARA